MEKFSKLMENTFKLRENGTTVKTEIIAGVTTFMTMAYILAVNPNILSSTGMDHGAVFTATALAAFLGTLLMALFANYPFALAPGMGLNAYLAYTVVLGYGYSWQAALTAVFAEGIIFIVLSLTNVREAIFNSIPVSLKSAVSVGIGLFIAFIGLQNAKIVLTNSSTVAGLYSLSSYNANLQSAATLNGTVYVAGTFNDVGITVLLAVIGVIFTAVLVVRNVKGNILWGILATWILGMICQACGLYVPNPANGFYSLFPDFSRFVSRYGAFGQRRLGHVVAAQRSDAENRTEHAHAQIGSNDVEWMLGVGLDVELGFAVEMYAAFVGGKCLVVAERRSGCKPDVGAIGHRYVHDCRVGIEVSDRRGHQGGTPSEHTGQDHDCDARSRSEQGVYTNVSEMVRETMGPLRRAGSVFERIDPTVESVERTDETRRTVEGRTPLCESLSDGA